MWHGGMGWIITDVSKNRSAIIVEGQDVFFGIVTLEDEGTTVFLGRREPFIQRRASNTRRQESK